MIVSHGACYKKMHEDLESSTLCAKRTPHASLNQVHGATTKTRGMAKHEILETVGVPRVCCTKCE